MKLKNILPSGDVNSVLAKIICFLLFAWVTSVQSAVQISDLTITGDTTKSVTVRWSVNEAPEDLKFCLSVAYGIQVRNFDINDSTARQKTVSMSSVPQCKETRFTLVALQGEAEVDRASANYTVIERPYRIKNLRAVNAKYSNDVMLKWGLNDSTVRGCLAYFKMTVNGVEQVLDPSTTTHKLTGITPGKQYIVSVFGVDNCGAYSMTECLQFYGRYGGTRADELTYKVITQPGNISFILDPPRHLSTNPVKSYEISYNFSSSGEPASVSSTELRVDVTDYQACASFEAKVYQITKDGVESPSSISPQQTLPYTPETPYNATCSAYGNGIFLRWSVNWRKENELCEKENYITVTYPNSQQYFTTSRNETKFIDLTGDPEGVYTFRFLVRAGDKVTSEMSDPIACAYIRSTVALWDS